MTTSPLSRAYGRFRAVLATVMVFSLAVNALMFVGPLYMLQIYDRVLASRNEYTLLALTLVAVALLASYGAMEFVRSRLLARAGLQFDEIVSAPLFERAVKLQLNNPSGGAAQVIGDADRVREFYTGPGILAFFDAPWVPVFLALIFAFHPWLGLVATVGALVIFSLALLNELATRRRLQAANQEGAQAQHFATATLQNAEVIRALGMQGNLAGRWLKGREGMLAGTAKAGATSGAVLAASKFVRMSLQVAILGTGAYLALRREISPGIMIAASVVMGRALAPVEQSVQQWRGFVGARQAGTRLRRLFDAIPDEAERTRLPEPRGALSVEGLTSTVPGSRAPVLRGVTFAIDPGTVLAVVGPSGSGKSTLVRHLAGVLRPAAGSVRLDGTDLANWDPSQLGRAMGYLPQDVRLFAGTVAENIARFEPETTDEEIVAAAQLAGAHDMIQSLTEGYEYEVGQGGERLSGGMRQRVGLARAVLRMPALVVLDEPNSNLDSAGEDALVACIAALKRAGRTVVVVTHKAHLLKVCDRALMMREGQVAGFGTPQEVLRPQAAPAPARRSA